MTALLVRQQARQLGPHLGNCQRRHIGDRGPRLAATVEVRPLHLEHDVLANAVLVGFEQCQHATQQVGLPLRERAIASAIEKPLHALGEVPARGLLGFVGEIFHVEGIA